MQSTRHDSSKTLKIWEKLIIIVGEDENAGYYEGRVEDFLNGGIVVNNPIFVSGNSMIRQDLPVTVQVCREDAIYQFASRIRSYTRGSGRRLVLSPPQSMRRIQRRQFVRIEMSAAVEYFVIPAAMDWGEWEESITWAESRTVDVSAGGLQFKVNSSVYVDDIVLVRVSIFAEEDLPDPIIGCVRRIFTRDNSHYCGLQFLVSDRPCDRMKASDYERIPAELKRFDSKHQDRLVNFLFRKQVEYRQKGIL